MKINTKQILSGFLTMSLIWVFIGCGFLCAENGDCAGDISVSTENFSNFDQPLHEDECPINDSSKTTAPDRIVLKLEFSAVTIGSFRDHSAAAILPDSLKDQTIFYRPPNITSQARHPFIIRI